MGCRPECGSRAGGPSRRYFPNDIFPSRILQLNIIFVPEMAVVFPTSAAGAGSPVPSTS